MAGKRIRASDVEVLVADDVLILHDVEPAAVLTPYFYFSSHEGETALFVQANGTGVLAHDASND